MSYKLGVRPKSEDGYKRDMTHAAVVPVVSRFELDPGDRVKICDERGDLIVVEPCFDRWDAQGVIDPFAEGPILPETLVLMLVDPKWVGEVSHHYSMHWSGIDPENRQPGDTCGC